VSWISAISRGQLRCSGSPATRERTWAFGQRRWQRLTSRMPSLLASRLVETTWRLLTPTYRRAAAREIEARLDGQKR
jgi:hypothetical protein